MATAASGHLSPESADIYRPALKSKGSDDIQGFMIIPTAKK